MICKTDIVTNQFHCVGSCAKRDYPRCWRRFCLIYNMQIKKDLCHTEQVVRVLQWATIWKWGVVTAIEYCQIKKVITSILSLLFISFLQRYALLKFLPLIFHNRNCNICCSFAKMLAIRIKYFYNVVFGLRTYKLFTLRLTDRGQQEVKTMHVRRKSCC